MTSTLSHLPSIVDSVIHSDPLPVDPANTYLETYLNSVRIVMVNTTLPANIGSAARAMLTMGLQDLVIVKPKHPIDENSMAHAAGARSVLEASKVVNTLEEALEDCQLVFAASSRQRHIPRPVVTPDEAARIIIRSSAAKNLSAHIPKVAILFGREDRGLTNEELSVADYHIQIDANPTYPVLNVASAVQVISSFMYSRFLQQSHKLCVSTVAESDEDSDKPTKLSSYLTDLETDNSVHSEEISIILRQVWDSPAINKQQKNSLQARIIELMHSLELVDSIETENLKELPSRLSRLLSRIQLDQKEFELLSAIVGSLKRKVDS